MTRLSFAALLAVPLLTGTVALAQEPTMRSLEVAARMSPTDGGAAIELANGYLRAGQTTKADAAYRRALALDNVMMQTPNGDSIWSHEVANRVLASQVALNER